MKDLILIDECAIDDSHRASVVLKFGGDVTEAKWRESKWRSIPRRTKIRIDKYGISQNLYSPERIKTIS